MGGQAAARAAIALLSISAGWQPLASMPLLSTQDPPQETVGRLVAIHAASTRLGRELGDSIWPGFRPDTIPVLFVLPERGTLLLGWQGDLPEGFATLSGVPGGWRPESSRGAASTGTTLQGRPTAQVVVGEQGFAETLGLVVHEAFHVFAGTARREGRRFGQGENSFLVTSYPVFAGENEAGMALEGQLLGAALRGGDRPGREAAVKQFLAARESRHRRLGAELAAFEQQAELNEGLAEYALVRAVELAARDPRFPDRTGAGRVAERLLMSLDTLTRDVTRSIRLRFYALGPAQARLLDQLEGPEWKARLMAENLTLQDALADITGYREAERALIRQAEVTHRFPVLRARADSGVWALRAMRRAQMDSILAAPGVLVVVSLDALPGRRVGLCGIDPQNLLPADAGVLLHTRWVQPCRGQALQATFNTPTVQDGEAGTLRAVVGPADSLRITIGGRTANLADGERMQNISELRLQSPSFTLSSARADLWREGRAVWVRPRE